MTECNKNNVFPTHACLVSQVILSLPCVLVKPKRKMAGRLAVMKSVLHFFGEFSVEGTGGSSIFKDFDGSARSDSNKYDHKQKFSRLAEYSESNSDKGVSLDNAEAENFRPKQSNNVKRHRRWNLGKVGSSLHLIFISTYYTISDGILLYVCSFVDKSGPLDAVFA